MFPIQWALAGAGKGWGGGGGGFGRAGAPWAGASNSKMRLITYCKR